MITDPLADSPEPRLRSTGNAAGEDRYLVGIARGRSYALGGRSGPQWALDGSEYATRHMLRFTAAGSSLGFRLSLPLGSP